MAKLLLRHSGTIALCLISGCLLFFLSFQYASLTSFPIGDDPAIHINNIKTNSFLTLTNQIYPLPLFIYKITYSISRVEASQLFTIVISSFLFFSGLALFIFVAKSFQNLSVAVAASIFFLADRWVADSLRMGTLAEVFGWGTLFLALAAFNSRNLIWALITGGVIGLSHPFAFLVYILIVMIYSLIIYRQGNEEDKKFLSHFISIAAIGGGLISLINPDVFQYFLRFRSGDAPGWGERTLWQMFIHDEPRLLVIPLLSIFGLASAIKLWDKIGIKLSIILLIVGLFMSLNHMLGIQFLPFRFYGYFIGGIAIFAGYGLIVILQSFRLSQWSTFILSVIFSIFFVLPSYQFNANFLNWQKNDPSAKASMQPSHREAMAWIKQNIPSEGQILAERRYGIWIRALADRQEIIFYDGEPERIVEYTKSRLERGPIYVFVPQNSELPLEKLRLSQIVYDMNNILIYRLDQ